MVASFTLTERKTDMKLGTSIITGIVAEATLVLVLVAGIVAACVYATRHPSPPVHQYDANDLAHDTAACQRVGMKTQVRTSHSYRNQETWIVGADCADAAGNIIPVPPQEQKQ